MPETIEQIELKDFITKALEDIEMGVDTNIRSFKDAIEFEISITKSQNLAGDVKIYVASGSGEVSKESISKIKFQVYPKITNTDQFAVKEITSS